MFESITKRSFGFNLLVALGLVLLMAILFFLSLGWITKHGKTLKVPDVTGKQLEEATNILEHMGFEVVAQDSIYIDSLPPLSVIRQSPEKDFVVKVGRTIYLTLNKIQPPMVPMPNLVSGTLRSAEMQLNSFRLRLGDTIYKPDFARGTVLDQLYNGHPIKPGTLIPEGSRITLVLSNGLGNVENPVPDLLGVTLTEAKEILSAQNLNIGVVTTDGVITDTANAYVFKQLPERYTPLGEINKIRAGELVDLWISQTRPAVKDSVKTPLPQQ